VVPTNIFGPHDNFNLEDGHVIPALIHKCRLARESGKPLVVAGSGRPLRQFIYSRDLARLLVWAVREWQCGKSNEGGADERALNSGAVDGPVLILSVDEKDEVSIAQVAEAIAEASNLDHGRIKYDPSQADGQFKKTASNQKLRALLPAFRFTSFPVAVKETVDWFDAHFAAARK
jgi:GDP-L-fucose synthase